MIKDLLQSMNNIYSDSNLNLHEKSILMYLIKQFNSKDGYSYPKYENIMEACSIGRRENISKNIKSLVTKVYITIKKVVGNKSHYFIEKYLHFVADKKEENIDSTVNQNSTLPQIEEVQVESKVEVKENATEEIKITHSSNASKIAKAFEHSNTLNISSWLLDRVSKIDETIVDIVLQEKPKTAKLFLVKCIERTLLSGLELAPIIRNTLNKYAKTDMDYLEASKTEYSSDFYMAYMDNQVGLI